MISLFKRGAEQPDADHGAEQPGARGAKQPSGELAEELDDSAATDANDTEAAKGVTPGKGRPTPKRVSRSTRYTPAPQSSKEARQRLKERTKAERAEQYEGMRRGDDKYLFARDQGPIRRLVRDIVDSRRNAGSWFFAGTLLVVVGSMGFMPPNVRWASTMLWVALIAIFILDAIYLSIRIRHLIKQRFSEDDRARGIKLVGHALYGVMRSVVFRRLRNPAPMVKIGDQI